MKITILSVGNKLESFESEWIGLFEKRLGHYVKTKHVRIKPSKKPVDDSLFDRIEEQSSNGAVVVLLDESGKNWDTKEWKGWIEKQENQSKSEICFVIGESHGLSKKIIEKFPLRLSLSKLTFPHNLALLVLFEQLYRVYSWKAGSPYHHA